MENGNREWDKLSPDSADAMCSSPHLHPTADDHRCSSTRQGNYAKFGLAPCRQTPPFPLLESCNLECSNSCNVFDFFNFSTINLSFLPFDSSNTYRQTLVASYGPSDPPKLVFTSVLLSRCCMSCCR